MPISASLHGLPKPVAVSNDKHVLPLEHVLVHKEFKKIYMFCQAGTVETLGHLFAILKHVDQELKDSGEGQDEDVDDGQIMDKERAAKSTQNKGASSVHSLEAAFALTLRHMLVWCTFADQLAAAKQKDRELLNQVHNFLVGRIKALSAKEERSETSDLCWRILLVGWDHLCRSTYQQIEVLKLALLHSSQEAEKQSAASAAAPALAPESTSPDASKPGA